MWKKLYEKFLSDELDIKERLFRIILLVGTAALTLAIAQGLVLQNSGLFLYMAYGIMLITFIGALVLTFRFQNSKLATILIGILIIVVGCPLIFIYGGGPESGAGIWLTLGVSYTYLMFSGITQTVFFILTIVAYVLTFVACYQIPGLMVPLASKSEVYFDIMFSSVIVGSTMGLIAKFQTKVFDRERQKTLEQQAELEKINKSKDTFFASMSHEIRTPINSIIGLNELIMRGDVSDETRGYAQNVQNASKLLLSLVNDILDLSQLEIKKMELVENTYSSRKMIQELIDVIQVRMNEKQLKFNIEIDRQLPINLIGDERRIKQVLLNILTNAVKYTQKGSVTLSCEVLDIEDNRAKLKFTVADTGCGIKKEELDYLFDAFKRADTIKNAKIEGTGLGLSITKQLVDLMGGTIAVDSIYTQGSVFSVTIEQKMADEARIGDIDFVGTRTMEKVEYKRSFEAPEARILVVDDDDLNLIITTKLLQETKISIETASRGEECLRKTRQRYYNLILMDYMMPDMDGVSVLNEIRKQENGLCRDVPVVLLSATSIRKFEEEIEKTTFNGFLEKPVSAERLEEEVLKFIPEDLVEYRRDESLHNQAGNMVSQLLSHKRKRVYITTDCACDIPKDLLGKYDIRMFYLYVKTKYGRFRDTKEIDVSNLNNYLADTGNVASVGEARLEEYEKFFAEALTEAEDVIHITVAKETGTNYATVMSAAKGFDHVHVIDSGHVSAGQGLIVLRAAQLAQEGKSVSEICNEIEHIKGKIDTQMLLPNSLVFYQNGFSSKFASRICEMFHLYPVVKLSKSKMVIYGTRWGSIEHARRNFLHFHLDNNRKYEQRVIFITHAGCSVKEVEMILEEVRKCADFEQIIVAPNCVTNACATGMGTITYAVFCL